MTTQTGRDQSPEPMSPVHQHAAACYGNINDLTRLTCGHDVEAELRAELATALAEVNVYERVAAEVRSVAQEAVALAEARAERAEKELRRVSDDRIAAREWAHECLVRAERAEAREDRREEDFVREWNLRIKRDGELARAERERDDAVRAFQRIEDHDECVQRADALERVRAALRTVKDALDSPGDLHRYEGEIHWHHCRGCDLRKFVGAALADSPAPSAFELRPEVQAFALLMEQQLRANDHKPGWKDDAPHDLRRRIGEELQELAEAMYSGQSSEVIGKEAADVANMAMMVADVCGALADSPAPLDAAKQLVRDGVPADGLTNALIADPITAYTAEAVRLGNLKGGAE